VTVDETNRFPHEQQNNRSGLVHAAEPARTLVIVTTTAPPSRILVIDDDPTLADVVGRYLTKEGFVVEIVGDGRNGLERALATLPDLVVLDLMLPGLDGFEVFRRLRRVAPIPVVMLTARGDEEDRITGLELGADDYVAKPFSPRELTARICSVLRRSAASTTAIQANKVQPVLVHGDLEVDLVAHEVRRGGTPLSFTVKEFELLAFVMSHAGQAFRREELFESVWGYTYGDTATVTVHVRRIREKIELDPSDPQLLSTVRGVGYRFAS
jgi:DNA-binding response OmpR family regulator